MDVEGGGLERQIKGPGVWRGRKTWQLEALAAGWINKEEQIGRRKESEYRAQQQPGEEKKKKGEATVCYIWESRECQEQDNSSFHVIGGKEKDRKAAVHNGTSEAFYWRWEEKAESQAQAEKRGRQRKKN